MVTLEEKIKAWREYEEKLLNKENECSTDLEMVKVEELCKKVFIKEVMEALNFVNAGKAAEPSGVTSELLKL